MSKNKYPSSLRTTAAHRGGRVLVGKDAKSSRKGVAHTIKRSRKTTPPPDLSQKPRLSNESVQVVEESMNILVSSSSELEQYASPKGKAGAHSNYVSPSNLQDDSDEFTVEERRGARQANLQDESGLFISEKVTEEKVFPVDSSAATLLVSRGVDIGRKISLLEGRTSIGRGLDSDIVLSDISVSRTHLYIERKGNVYILTDAKSGNGTMINGRLIKGEMILMSDDSFQIGKTTINFEGGVCAKKQPENNWAPKDMSSHPQSAAGVPLEEEPTNIAHGYGRIATPDPIPVPVPNAAVSRAPLNLAVDVGAQPDEVQEQRSELLLLAEQPNYKQNSDHSVVVLESKDISSLTEKPIQKKLPSRSRPRPRPSSVAPIALKDLVHSQAANKKKAEDAAVHTRSAVQKNSNQGFGANSAPLIQKNSGAPLIQKNSGIPNSYDAYSGHSPMAPLERLPGQEQSVGNYPGVLPIPVPNNRPPENVVYPPQIRPQNAVNLPNQAPYPPVSSQYRPIPQAKTKKNSSFLLGVVALVIVCVLGGLVTVIVLRMKTGAQSGGATNIDQSKPGHDIAKVDPQKLGPKAGTVIPTSNVTYSTARLIAGNTVLPDSIWGNDESFLSSLPESVPIDEPKIESMDEPNIESTDEPNIESTDEPNIESLDPLVDAPSSEDKLNDTKDSDSRTPDTPESKNDSGVGKKETRKGTRSGRSKTTNDRPRVRKSSINVAAVRRAAKALYKKRKFNSAATKLENAADRSSAADAEKLLDLASGYSYVGSLITKAEEFQQSNPKKALKAYKKAMSKDKSIASGVHTGLLRSRIGQVAVKAAMSHMASGELSSAKKAADTASRYGQRSGVEKVYGSLERKAISLIRKAKKKEKSGDDKGAIKLLTEATRIAPKDTDAYSDARTKLREF